VSPMSTSRRAAAAIGVFAVAVLVVYAVARPRPSREWMTPPARVQTPAAPGSTEPQLTAQGDHVLLSWIATTDERAMLMFAERTNAGWSQPRAVASGDDWFVNSADVPSVMRLADGTLAAQWLQNSASGADEAYDLRLSFSHDAGVTWSPPATPHHDGAPVQHGFASLFEAAGGSLGLVWLDGRLTSGEGHSDREAGAMTLRASVFAPDGTQAPELLIDERVCDCCPTATAVTADGAIVAYRDRSENETRDISVSRLVDGRWTAPATVHDDGWQINACPVNGPALSARGRDVAVAWFHAKEEEGRAFVAFSRDSGRTFGAPIRIDDAGALGRVDVELLDDGSAAVSWVEFVKPRAQFRVRRVTPSGVRSASVMLAAVASGPTSGYPRMARRGAELLFAWDDGPDGSTSVQTAAAQLSGSSLH
jgi:hypothetical protein